MSPSATSHSDTIDPLDTTAPSATSTPPPPSSSLQRIPPPFIFSHPDSQDNNSNRPKDAHAHADPYSSLKRQSSPRPSFLESYKRRASQDKDVGKMGVADDSNGTVTGHGAGHGHGRTGSTGSGLQAPRPHLNALSPLQSFTSLQPVSVPSTTTTTTTTAMRRNSHSRNTSLHSNASSLASSPSQHAVHSGTTNGLGIYHGHAHGQGHGKGFGPMTPLTLSNLTRATGPLSAQGTDGSDSGLDPLTIHPHPHPHPRTPSVTRSLSRRESMIAKTSMVAEFGFVGGTGAASPGAAREADRGERGGAVSKLTLVRAFSGKRAGAGVGNANAAANANANAGGEERMDRPGVNRRRTKSGSNLSPFSFTPSAPLTTSTSNPSNLSGLLFSPPPAVGFARSPGPADLGVGLGASGGQASSTEPNPGPGSSATRANFLFESMGGNGWVSSGSLKTCNPLNIHQETKNLSPDQVLELVEGLRSPVLATPHARFSNRDRRGSDVSLASKAAGGEGTELEPVEYVEMNDDVLLPYVDRAAEVKELMEQASNYELFEIIRPTFPKESKITESTPLRATPLRSVDPEDWTWEEFQTHLLLSRAECDDFEWIKLARSAVRARSEALWERIGVCLGCDGDLLNAGETEIGTAGHHTAALSDVFDASTTAGSPVLSAHPDEFMNHDHVWVEGLSATEPEEMDPDHYHYPSLGERAPSIGSIPGTPGGLMDVAEEEESQSDTKSPPSLTPAQIAGGRGEPMDPFGRETSPNANARSKELPGSIPLASVKSRARSFVGVQISTTPSLPAPASVHRPSYSVLLPGGLERGPGHPLFPSSFSTLSLAPTLPNNNPALKASLSFSQAADAMGHQAHGNPARAALQSMMGMNRKQSRSGLSESAITFGSEDY